MTDPDDPKGRLCPECGVELEWYDIEGSIRIAVADDRPDHDWAWPSDFIDTYYGACGCISHLFCPKCSASFSRKTGKKYVKDPMDCLRELAEHIMDSLENDKVPLPPKSVNLQVLEAMERVVDKRIDRLENNDPNILP